MLGLGSIIGSGLGVAGSIFGAIKASQAAKQARKKILDEKRENENWYNRVYSEDATQRADAQRMLTAMDERIRDRNRAAAGTQAVMGGTGAGVALERDANSAAMADAASQIAVNGEARKERAETQYQTTNNALNNQLQGIENRRSQSIIEAANQALTGLSTAGQSLDDWLDARAEEKKAGTQS